MENNICMVSWNRCFEKWLLTRIHHNSLKNIWIDPTGFNTNPKGGNRLWRTIFAWFREIEVLKSVFSQESAVTLLKTYESTKRALIQTRRGEIEYGEQYLHGFTKTTFHKVTSITRPKPYQSTKRALIRTRRVEIDYGEQYSHGFAKSTFLTR